MTNIASFFSAATSQMLSASSSAPNPTPAQATDDSASPTPAAAQPGSSVGTMVNMFNSLPTTPSATLASAEIANTDASNAHADAAKSDQWLSFVNAQAIPIDLYSDDDDDD